MNMKRSQRSISTVDNIGAVSDPGKIGFDDRGNAFFEWQTALQAEGVEAALQRRRALNNPTLSLLDDDDSSQAAVRVNKKGARVGYNPYDSGILARKVRKKTDMRALSEWISLKKQIAKTG